MLEIFSALADPNRYRVVELLRRRPRVVGDIVSALDLPQPLVSKHLRILKDARLVEMRPMAQRRLYRLNPGALRELHDWTERYRALWDARLDGVAGLVAELHAARSEEGGEQ